ncbi:MAG: TonB-dependent receptor, partial [Bryobacteraceae bacterium]
MVGSVSRYACLASLVFSAALYGQIPTGAIQGNVTDPTSAAVQGAEVLLNNELTGVQRAATTSDQGIYSFNYLDSGEYRLTVKLAGFQTAVYPGIAVRVGDKVRVDVPLAVGEVTSTVEVSGGGALVQTDTAVVGNVISRREVTEMPVRGREFSQLATLLPGVRATGSTGGALITQFATALTVGGTSSSKNDYTVDGVDNTFNVWNGPAMNPSIDSIQEFRIDRSLFSAEFGRGGAQLHLITKAGTNQYHGVVWEYLRNKVLNGGNYVSHQQDNLKRNQYGANLGGPILRNKLFFFFNWESQRERSTVQPLGTVFTDAMRRGDLTGYPKVVTDPTTGQPFPGNVIPTSRLNPVSLALMDAMLPRANLSGFQNNLIRPFTTSRDWDQYIGRVDYQISSNDTLFVRFTQQPRTGISAPLAATSINHNEDFNCINGGIGWTRIWSPRLTSETRFGDHYERLLLQSQPLATLPSRAVRGFGPVQPPPDRLPVVNITDTAGFHQWGFPLGFEQNAYEFVQNVTYARGKHLIKAGFSGNTVSLVKNKSPEYQFTLGFTGAYTGTGPGDYLLGLPFSASESLGFVTRKQKYGNYSFFVQDDWKVTPSLTVNLGLRYELST